MDTLIANLEDAKAQVKAAEADLPQRPTSKHLGPLSALHEKVAFARRLLEKAQSEASPVGPKPAVTKEVNPGSAPEARADARRQELRAKIQRDKAYDDTAKKAYNMMSTEEWLLWEEKEGARLEALLQENPKGFVDLDSDDKCPKIDDKLSHAQSDNKMDIDVKVEDQKQSDNGSVQSGRSEGTLNLGLLSFDIPPAVVITQSPSKRRRSDSNHSSNQSSTVEQHKSPSRIIKDKERSRIKRKNGGKGKGKEKEKAGDISGEDFDFTNVSGSDHDHWGKWQTKTDEEKILLSQEAATAVSKTLAWQKSQGSETVTQFATVTLRGFMREVQTFCPESSYTTLGIFKEVHRTGFGNLVCGYHQNHSGKNQILRDGDEEALYDIMGQPMPYNLSKNKSVPAPLVPGHFHCGCNADEVTIGFYIWKTWSLTQLVGRIADSQEGFYSGSLSGGTRVTEGLGTLHLSPRIRTFLYQHLASVGITVESIFCYGCSEDEALAALLHSRLMVDLKQYNVVLRKLGRIQVGEEHYIGGGPPAALEESDRAQDPEY
ncbi:hypothetical protein C8J57DRAFT_1510212 [Mycena rebaudengoi]|nr:hypothetical protein C8J57DRAFT_1510212 [Mycena rebaudengoi]